MFGGAKDILPKFVRKIRLCDELPPDKRSVAVGTLYFLLPRSIDLKI